MDRMLQKIGRGAYRHPWRIIAAWLVVLGVLAGVATLNYKAPTTAITIPGTAGQSALDKMNQLFPDAGRGSARIVFAAPEGKTLDDFRTTIDETSSAIGKVDGVRTVISPFQNPAALSEDRMIGITQVQLDQANGSVDKTTTEQVSELVAKARHDQLTVEMGGDILNKAPGDILGIGEVGGVIIALMVLVMTLGSLVAAGLPLVVALITVGVSMGGLFGLSQVVDISSTTPVLAVMLGLAVGIDYSLFIVSKYRHYLLEGAEAEQAAVRATMTAGHAVIFAAGTVVIALSALSVVNIPFMTTMGLAGAATVALAALIAVSVLPALLRLSGKRIFGPKTRQKIAKAQKAGFHDTVKSKRSSIWYRWGQQLTRRPILFSLVGLVIVGAIAWPARSLELGLPLDQYAAKDTTERKAYDLVAKGFGDGYNGPLALVVTDIAPVTEAQRQEIRAGLLQQFETKATEAEAKQQQAFAERAQSVATPEQYQQLQADIAQAQANGEQQKQAALRQIDVASEALGQRANLQKIADEVARRGDVKSAQAGLASDDGSQGVIQVIPASGPGDAATLELIRSLRDPAVQADLNGGVGTFAVTGSTALQADVNQKLAEALPLYLAVVVGLSLILLLVAFRSIIIPLKATLGFLLSVGAMFGALVAVFQWGWLGIAEAPGPIVSFIPIIAIGVLFGLAMDYEFFLVSSMHEAHEKGDSPREAVVDGFGVGSKVVTAAAVIMTAIFAGFIFNHDATIQAIGFGLAVGVFVDAFIVRMTLTPAIMTLLGRSAWWLPGWLQKIVPRVSIEGGELSSKKSKS